MAALLSLNVFADDFTKSLHNISKTINALDGTKATPATGTIPAGKDIFPIVWKYAYNEPTLEKGVLAFQAEIKSIDLYNKSYEMVQRVYYKFGIGLQCQESFFTVQQEDVNVSVLTTKMHTFGVDRNLKRTNEPYASQPKSLVVNSQNILNDMVKDAETLEEAKYNEWADKCYTNLSVQQLAGATAGNKLKAKKWFEAHPIEGKSIQSEFAFKNLAESDKEGYSYKITGSYMSMNGVDISLILATIYSNDDKCMDFKEGQKISVSGKITKVNYSGTSEFSTKYEISSIVIEE